MQWIDLFFNTSAIRKQGLRNEVCFSTKLEVNGNLYFELEDSHLASLFNRQTMVQS